jgi:hypothetical protein
MPPRHNEYAWPILSPLLLLSPSAECTRIANGTSSPCLTSDQSRLSIGRKSRFRVRIDGRRVGHSHCLSSGRKKSPRRSAGHCCGSRHPPSSSCGSESAPLPNRFGGLLSFPSASGTPKRKHLQIHRSRRPDSNRGPLHYESWAAVTLSHRESPQVTRRAESHGLEMTRGDW